LAKAYPGEPFVIETICVLGAPPKPKNREKQNQEMLKAADARYITYDQLIRQTRDSYRDYLQKQKEISRIQELIEQL
jgi:hypothetical protein